MESKAEGPKKAKMSNVEQKLALRIKSKKSQNTIIRDVSTAQTVNEFLSSLSPMTDIPEDKMIILTGFPPKKIEFDRLAPLESLGLSNQDTLIVEMDINATATQPSVAISVPVAAKTPEFGSDMTSRHVTNNSMNIVASSSSSVPVKNQLIINALNASTVKELVETRPADESTVAIDHSSELSRVLSGTSTNYPQINSINEGMLLRNVVPADNSCLFTSISFCLSGNLNDIEDPGATHMRELIAATVASNPERFDDAMLGRPNPEYVQWIMKSESWGGGIEISILSEFYQMEISVVDIQSLHISRFGEDKNYSQRMLLLYDGIHYDPLYMDPFDGSKIRTLFPTSEESILDKGIQLGREAKAAHQFTDLSNFSLKCGICNKLLKGQVEAQAHAKQTGHTNFAEITN